MACGWTTWKVGAAVAGEAPTTCQLTTVSRLQDPSAVVTPAVEQRLQEGEVVASRRVKGPAARPELRHEQRLQRLGRERAVGLPLVHARLPRALLVGGDVAAVLHAERGEDLVAEVRVERLAADRLDQASGPIDADAVLALVARVEDQRHAQRGDLAGGGRGHPRRRHGSHAGVVLVRRAHGRWTHDTKLTAPSARDRRLRGSWSR